MAKIQTLKDSDNTVLYPVSKAQATYLSDNATDVETELEKKPEIQVTDLDPGEGVPLDANKFIAVYGNSGKVHTSDIADNAVTSDKIDFTTMKRWVPDYANTDKTNFFSRGQHTMTQDGWVSFYMYGWSLTYADKLCLVSVNGEDICNIGNVVKDSHGAYSADIGSMVQVSKGDVISFDSHGNIEPGAWAHFIPGKWV